MIIKFENYSNMENLYLDFVFNKIKNEKNTNIWLLCSSFKSYLNKYYPGKLNEFYYKITDEQDPSTVMLNMIDDIKEDKNNIIIKNNILKLKNNNL
jgi:hypothetical protein